MRRRGGGGEGRQENEKENPTTAAAKDKDDNDDVDDDYGADNDEENHDSNDGDDDDSDDGNVGVKGVIFDFTIDSMFHHAQNQLQALTYECHGVRTAMADHRHCNSVTTQIEGTVQVLIF